MNTIEELEALLREANRHWRAHYDAAMASHEAGGYYGNLALSIKWSERAAELSRELRAARIIDPIADRALALSARTPTEKKEREGA